MTCNVNLYLHAFEPASRANGPGLRAVVWFQGCTLGCSGCFNPQTHDRHDSQFTNTQSLTEKVLSVSTPIEGVSVSGGEPLQQPEALLDFFSRLKSKGLSTLIFSGYTLKEIHKQPLGSAILNLTDVLIAGRYLQTQHIGTELLGSANQQIHLLTDRYCHKDFTSVPASELILHTDGSMTISGIRPKTLPLFSSLAK